MNTEILKSFIEVSSSSHFPIQNLPYGVFTKKPSNKKRIGTAIGDLILDLTALESRNMFSHITEEKMFDAGSLNLFMSKGWKVWSEVRSAVQNLLRTDNPTLRDNSDLKNLVLVPQKEVSMCLPAEIGDYTDFYSSKEHATNVGIMFRGKENALMPNWLHIPIAYHGRSSSIVISETDIIRPKGQTKTEKEAMPKFGPCKLLDFELEMGYFIGTGNELGIPVDVNKAIDHIFGMVIVNDWSARDIQKWEYQPLGPFLGKNFATSISPWIVTMETLEPFRTKGPEQNPEPLPYLQTKESRAYDINLEVCLKTSKMTESFVISKMNFKYMYWNICQQLAHHTVNGCSLRTGDLLASGTISGHTKDSRGSMLELSWNGTEPIKLPNGEERKFLEDGDTVIMSAWCVGSGYKVGFGEVTGKILPAN